jgi:hypothetical protein
LLQIVCKPQLVPILNQEVTERYAISPSPPATIGLPLDEIEKARQNARSILVRKQQKMTGRQGTPLRLVKYVGGFNEEGESEGGLSFVGARTLQP